MEHLLKCAVKLNVDSISLTVDNNNLSAIKLYEKFKFKIEAEVKNYLRYKLTLSN